MSVNTIIDKFFMEWQVYKEFYRKTIFTVLISGILTALLLFFASLYFENFIIEQSRNIAEQTAEVNNKEKLTNLHNFFSILVNNLFVGGIIILLGFLPVYGLPFIIGLLSFAAVGILSGYGLIMEHNVIKTLIIAFVPHAVIEIIPILYSVAIGMYVNKNIFKKVFFRKMTTYNIREIIKNGIKSYILIIIPLFFLAALVEAFITSYLVEIYL
ncbi:stage II sporulation protein M [Rossellomorea sp. SC111]|uniref:stage II sporulation protein M n=1 Tax=Rossellomorea sp. SC111 TaxID=2968985 RepID=UPI00215A6E98|nr:stage II sporulation protein M [Rossellomorea sp. SC111]MCR8848411.1 stage II sporulation protein M [Rossellomorea sp. SC111]